MKKLLAALTMSVALTATGTATATDHPSALKFSIGIYAAEDAVKDAWACENVLRSVEAVMSAELNQPVELNAHADDSYPTGVAEMMSGQVQIGRFPNIKAKWVLNARITDDVANAWLVALRAVNPEARLNDSTVGARGHGTGCDPQVALNTW